MSQSERRRHKARGSNDSADERREAQSDRRRAQDMAPSKPKAEGVVTFDDRGNAVWDWRVDTPQRREDDPTIDFLKCLDVDGLEIEDEDSASDNTINSFNPYSRG